MGAILNFTPAISMDLLPPNDDDFLPARTEQNLNSIAASRHFFHYYYVYDQVHGGCLTSARLVPIGTPKSAPVNTSATSFIFHYFDKLAEALSANWYA
jgi:hypothetical protein